MSTNDVQGQEIQPQETTPPPANPPQVQEQQPPNRTRRGCGFLRKLYACIFYAHLFLVGVFVVALTVRNLLVTHPHPHFRPLVWYPPLLCSTGIAAIMSFAWQVSTLYSPSRTLRFAFWVGPVMTAAAGIAVILDGTLGSVAESVMSVFSAIVLCVYSCGITPRLNHAAKILSLSMSPPPAKDPILTILNLIIATLYSCVIVAGIGGITQASAGTLLGYAFIAVLLLSLAWTMQVIKNILLVAVSQVKYTNLKYGRNADIGMAFQDAVNHSMGIIAVGSAFAPLISLFRGSIRAVDHASNGPDEVTQADDGDCFHRVASMLVLRGNRWGFVHVGVYDKGFMQASADVWETFRRAKLLPLIDNDVTGSFCFTCSYATGGVCAFAGGVWSLVVKNGYAVQIAAYAYIIGYFMCQVAMAWPQACVSAYHVAYAENPENTKFDSTIPKRVEILERIAAWEPREFSLADLFAEEE